MYKYIFFTILLIAIIAPFLLIQNIDTTLFGYVENNYVLSSLVYVVLLIMSVVVAPFTMPMFFISGGIFGPFIAAIYNIIGWSIGAVIAFLIARFFKKTFLKRFISFKKIAIYEKKIPQNSEFLGIIFLRMVLPVDVLSYALGVFSNISFARYTVATVIGITPFAIIFAYGGSVLFEGRYLLTFIIMTVVVIFFAIGISFLKNKKI